VLAPWWGTERPVPALLVGAPSRKMVVLRPLRLTRLRDRRAPAEDGSSLESTRPRTGVGRSTRMLTGDRSSSSRSSAPASAVGHVVHSTPSKPSPRPGEAAGCRLWPLSHRTVRLVGRPPAAMARWERLRRQAADVRRARLTDVWASHDRHQPERLSGRGPPGGCAECHRLTGPHVDQSRAASRVVMPRRVRALRADPRRDLRRHPPHPRHQWRDMLVAFDQWSR